MEAGPDIFQAIADGTRRRILELLQDGEKPVRELVGEFDISFPAVSQHLRVLHNVGLVTRRADGRRRLYQADPRRLEEVYRWTARYRDFWEKRFDVLAETLENED